MEYYSNKDMYIKIWFNDKPLFLADAITNEIAPYAHHDDAVLIDEFSPSGIKSMIHEMNLDKVHAGIFLHNNLPELQKAFTKKFHLVKAAGGLVKNSKDEVLMIFRRGKWDLPKGKLDPAESLEACAIREVQEETGINAITLEKPLTITYHTYDENGRHILKESHWYQMNSCDEGSLQPQLEEDISKAEWTTAEQLKKYVSNTYPSVIDVLKTAGYL
jgi:8-oxo-dGTP pyrophosphatase MutT (NUDIX family)